MKKAAKTAAQKTVKIKMLVAEPTGLEPATSNVTEQNSGFQISLKYKQKTHLRKAAIRLRLNRSYLCGVFWAHFGHISGYI